MESKSIQQFFNSYSLKMVVVSVLAIVLLIPSFLIQEIIQERIALSEQVKAELFGQWGGKQVISGPVLNVPYRVIEPLGNNQGFSEKNGVSHFLPESLMVDGEMVPESRQRGIYKVVAYEGRLKMSGSFAQPDVSGLDMSGAQFNWNAAYFTLGISDMRGVKNLPELILNGQKITVESGVADNDLFTSGITVKPDSLDSGKPLTFEIDLVLNGSEDLSVEALGKVSDVRINSVWPHPGFTGGFLPSSREISADGFKADWKVTHLNRNFPQQWTDNKFKTDGSRLGVELIIPVDHYQKSMRSVKYAILFIALNFIVFIFIEISSKVRIHPFQYSLVAFALIIFYALLTSLGEQIGFNLAYLVSALAVTALITWFSASLLRNKTMAIRVASLQAGLYIFLFAILQLNDYALLTGSVGLFIILAVIMRASLKVKWYSDTE